MTPGISCLSKMARDKGGKEGHLSHTHVTTQKTSVKAKYSTLNTIGATLVKLFHSHAIEASLIKLYCVAQVRCGANILEYYS